MDIKKCNKKNKIPIVTVIIPIFNVELYLKECLDSIINQTYSNLEIILVNDGSQDICGDICDEYTNQDSRIKVIHKGNGGLSDARNAGIDICTGDYISFVDSDDIVHPKFIELLLMNLIQFKSNIAICSILKFDEQPIVPKIDFESMDIELWDRNEFRNNIINSNYYPQVVTACSKLYSNFYFKKLRFKKNIYHEDELILHQIVELSEKCSYVNLPLYFYRNNPLGITNSNLNYSKKINDAIYCFDERIKFYEQKKMFEYVQLLKKELIYYKLGKYLNNQYSLSFLEKIIFFKHVIFSNMHYKSKLLYFIKALFKFKK